MNPPPSPVYPVLQRWQGFPPPHRRATPVRVLAYLVNKRTGRYVVKNLGMSPKNGFVLAASAPLEDIPRRVRGLPAVDFGTLWVLHGVLQQVDCVVEVRLANKTTHRFFLRAIYSSTAPGNGALQQLCEANKLCPWTGEIAIVELGRSVPYRKTVNKDAAEVAIVKFMRRFRWKKARNQSMPEYLSVRQK